MDTINRLASVGRPLSRTFWPALAALALALPAPALAQDQLDSLRIDSLMTIVADRMQSGALAAAREDVDALIEARDGLFGYGGVFVDILGELAEADCSRAPSWVQSTAQHLFIVTERLTLALDRSTDGEMDRWPAGPELILDDLEFLRETWDEIKSENRETCSRGDLPIGRMARQVPFEPAGTSSPGSPSVHRCPRAPPEDSVACKP